MQRVASPKTAGPRARTPSWTGGRACAWSCSQHAGCRRAPAAHPLVRECLIALGLPDSVLVRVGDYPSPTVLVNGTDVMRPAAQLTQANACRIDVPTREPADSAHGRTRRTCAGWG